MTGGRRCSSPPRTLTRPARRAPGAAAASGLLLALACSSAQPPPPPEALVETYRVAHPDMLSIQIAPEPEIELATSVRPDGKVSVELIGDVQAEGLTTREIARRIEVLMAEYRLHPVVSVSVAQVLSPTVTVLGEVRSPGRIRLERTTRLAEAVAQAGGTTTFAAKSRVRLIRREGEMTVTYEANLDDIQEGDERTNAVLESGDLVMVPPATPVAVGYALRRALYPAEIILGTVWRSVYGVFFP